MHRDPSFDPSTGELLVKFGNNSTFSPKVNVENDTDGLFYTLCLTTVDGITTHYWSLPGNARIKAGALQIRSDTTGLWHTFGSVTIDGIVTHYINQTGEA